MKPRVERWRQIQGGLTEQARWLRLPTADTGRGARESWGWPSHLSGLGSPRVDTDKRVRGARGGSQAQVPAAREAGPA